MKLEEDMGDVCWHVSMVLSLRYKMNTKDAHLIIIPEYRDHHHAHLGLKVMRLDVIVKMKGNIIIFKVTLVSVNVVCQR